MLGLEESTAKLFLEDRETLKECQKLDLYLVCNIRPSADGEYKSMDMIYMAKSDAK